MENIRTYEEMENYVRSKIENSWDFITTLQGCMYMSISIRGAYYGCSAYARWLAGDEAEEETIRKAVLEAETFFEITEEEAYEMWFSDEWEERDLAEGFYRRVDENKDEFWEPEYMAAMDEPETEENIKKLAADLWKQWKEYELDE